MCGLTSAQTKPKAKKPAATKPVANAATPYTGDSEFSMTKFYAKHYPNDDAVVVIKGKGFTDLYEVVQPFPVKLVQTYYPATDTVVMRPAVTPVPVGFKLLRKPGSRDFIVVYQPLSGGGQKRACLNKVPCPPDIDCSLYVRKVTPPAPPVVRNEPPPKVVPPAPKPPDQPPPEIKIPKRKKVVPQIEACNFESKLSPVFDSRGKAFFKGMAKNVGKGLGTAAVGFAVSGGGLEQRGIAAGLSFGGTIIGGGALDAAYRNANAVTLNFFNKDGTSESTKFKLKELEEQQNLPIRHNGKDGYLRYEPGVRFLEADFGPENKLCNARLAFEKNNNHFFFVNRENLRTKTEIVEKIVPGPSPKPTPCTNCGPPLEPKPKPTPVPEPKPTPNPAPVPTPKPNPVPAPTPKPNPNPPPGCTGNCGPVTPPVKPPTTPPGREPVKTVTTPTRSPG